METSQSPAEDSLGGSCGALGARLGALGALLGALVAPLEGFLAPLGPHLGLPTLNLTIFLKI